MEPCVYLLYLSHLLYGNHLCKHLHYESVYFKELHMEQEYYIQSGGSCCVNYYQFLTNLCDVS